MKETHRPIHQDLKYLSEDTMITSMYLKNHDIIYIYTNNLTQFSNSTVHGRSDHKATIKYDLTRENMQIIILLANFTKL